MSKRPAPDETPIAVAQPASKRRRLGKYVTMADIGPDGWRLLCEAGGEVVARGLAQCNRELRTICDPVVAKIGCPLRCVTGQYRAMFWYGRYGNGADVRFNVLADARPVDDSRVKQIREACFTLGKILRMLEAGRSVTRRDKMWLYSAYCLVTALYRWRAPAMLQYEQALIHGKDPKQWDFGRGIAWIDDSVWQYFNAIFYACGSAASVTQFYKVSNMLMGYTDTTLLYFLHEPCFTSEQRKEIGELMTKPTDALLHLWRQYDIAGLEALIKIGTLQIPAYHLLNQLASPVNEFFTSEERFGRYWPLFKQMRAWRGTPFDKTSTSDLGSLPWPRMHELGIFDLFAFVELDGVILTRLSTDPVVVELVQSGKLRFKDAHNVALHCLLPSLQPLYHAICEWQRKQGLPPLLRRGDAYRYLHWIQGSIPGLVEAKAIQILDTLGLSW